ncbi:hypothetical protein G3570_07065 [Balneolaceae bacterium YR4-1]|uniref:Uncharacterized protein n=1 Tax=Halalkalibaculum roseum TaxID=2709311 RepID=A0A6M1T304_9BACT|nr:hypothetical protein [Halalkalibaculum roseum]NGP76385.1 hypothetical protein [Halalkalibaculum roseum]
MRDTFSSIAVNKKGGIGMLRYKIIFTLLLSILLFISCSDYKKGTDDRPAPPIKHELVLKKDQNKWKVRKPRVTRGDTLVWVAPDSSDMSFQFPGNISRFLEPLNDQKDKLTDGYLKYLKAGDSLRLVVKRTAPYRVIEYAIFVLADSMYVEGDTPPEIQVEW